MVEHRAVRAAERRVELRKQQVRERWGSLRERGREALVSPAALGTFALLGGVIGWRSSRSSEKRHAAKPEAVRSPSPAGSILRGMASGLLRTIAAIAVEEVLKGQTAGGAEGPDMAAKH